MMAGLMKKTSEEDMNTYYGNSSLRKVAETLDTTVGIFEITKACKKYPKSMWPLMLLMLVSSRQSQGVTKQEIFKRIQALLDKITVAQPAEPTPSADAEALQNAREELGTITTPTETVAPTPINILTQAINGQFENAIEQGGTPILNALKIENILDGQECVTPSGHKGKVIDHITLPDGSPALRIEITEGSLKGIWGTFDQEDLNNRKVLLDTKYNGPIDNHLCLNSLWVTKVTRFFTPSLKLGVILLPFDKVAMRFFTLYAVIYGKSHSSRYYWI